MSHTTLKSTGKIHTEQNIGFDLYLYKLKTSHALSLPQLPQKTIVYKTSI